MFEFILLFIFFWWLFSRNEKRKERKRKLFKPSLDQELKELIQAEDNSTGIALSVKQYLLDVLDDDKNDKDLSFDSYSIKLAIKRNKKLSDALGELVGEVSKKRGRGGKIENREIQGGRWGRKSK